MTAYPVLAAGGALTGTSSYLSQSVGSTSIPGSLMSSNSHYPTFDTSFPPLQRFNSTSSYP